MIGLSAGSLAQLYTSLPLSTALNGAGRRVGIDPRYHVEVTNHTRAMDGGLMQEMIKGKSESDGGALTKAMNAAVAYVATDDVRHVGIDADPLDVVERFPHRFHGYTAAHDLGVPFHPETSFTLGRYVSTVRGEQSRLRRNPDEWKLAVRQNMKHAMDMLGAGVGGDTSYHALAAGKREHPVI